MNEKKQTKKALIMSVTSMVLCVAMLVGMTFAWFTDTASTAVNKIQAGNLDIALEMQKADGTWESAAGKTLTFKTTDNRTADQILWEPGCTYELPTLRVVNKGNLALKYKIAITGIQGDAKLNKVIDWTIGNIELGKNESLAVGENKEFTIKGHMQESAGNDYQGLSIDGISITVYATQDAVESDSFGNDYDKNANGLPDYPNWDISADVTKDVATTGNTVLSNADKTAQITVPQGAVADNVTKLTLTVTPATKPSTVTVTATQGNKCYDVKLTDQDNSAVTSSGGAKFEVKLFVGKGLTDVGLYHKEDAVDAADYAYDVTTGYITFKTSTFSPFTIVYKNPVAVSSDTYTYDLSSSLENGGKWALLDSTSMTCLPDFEDGVNSELDLNGKTLSLTMTGLSTTHVRGGSKFVIKNGSLKAVKIRESYTALFVCEADSTLDLDNVTLETKAAGIFPLGKDATVNVNNSVIKAGGYGIGSNAAKKDYYDVIVTIKDSTITTHTNDNDNTAVYLNVPGTYKIINSTITGDRQGMFVRGGTATVKNSKISTTGKFKNDKSYLTGNWESGNEIPCGALVLGNRSSNAYQYATKCTLEGTTLQAGNGVRTLYVYANTEAGIGTTLTYDSNCNIGDIEPTTLPNNVTINKK